MLTQPATNSKPGAWAILWQEALNLSLRACAERYQGCDLPTLDRINRGWLIACAGKVRILDHGICEVASQFGAQTYTVNGACSCPDSRHANQATTWQSTVDGSAWRVQRESDDSPLRGNAIGYYTVGPATDPDDCADVHQIDSALWACNCDDFAANNERLRRRNKLNKIWDCDHILAAKARPKAYCKHQWAAMLTRKAYALLDAAMVQALTTWPPDTSSATCPRCGLQALTLVWDNPHARHIRICNTEITLAGTRYTCGWSDNDE